MEDVPYDGADPTSRWSEDFDLRAKAAEKRLKEYIYRQKNHEFNTWGR